MLDLVRGFYFVFAGFTVAGGLVGYVKAKSVPSLVAGTVAGAALLVAGYLVSRASTPRTGLFLGLAVSLLLAGRFAPAYFKTKKAMPAGVMAALAFVSLVLTLLTLLR